MKKPILHLYSVCYNEEFIIPFYLEHYRRFVDKIVILDNKSTDNSAQLLSGHSDVMVKTFDSDNEYREDILTQIRNSVWKNSRGKADYVIVCDMDEFFHTSDFISFFFQVKEKGYTVIKPMGYDMISEELPKFGKPITDQIKRGTRNTHFDKPVIIDPNKVEETNFSPGSHTAIPEGRIKLLQGMADVRLLHYRYLSRNYILEKHGKMDRRRSKIAVKNNWGYHYSYSDQKQLQIFQKVLDNSQTII